MKFICETGSLINGINIAQKAMGTRTTMPVLEGIYIEAVKSKLMLKCTDMALCIETYVDADVSDEGAIVLPGRMFAEIVRKMPSDSIEISSDTERAVKIKSGNSRTTLQGLSAKEFPELPKVEEEYKISMKQKVFKELIRKTIFASSVDESKPILTGTLLEIEENKINFVALDGYRLALCTTELDKNYGNIKAVIPSRSLSEMSKIMSDDDGEVFIKLGKNNAMIEMDDTHIYSRLLEGDFIKYRQILPENFKLQIKLNRELFTDAIDRASLMAREGKSNLVKMSITEDKMIVTANSEMGDVYEEVDIYCDGNALDIAFNARYFTDVLKVLNDDEVYMDFNSSVSPCLIRPIEGSGYLYLVLPVRLLES